MVCPSIYPRSRNPCWKAGRQGKGRCWEPGSSTPTLGVFSRTCAWAVSGAASRLKVSVTMHPTALYHIVVSLSRIHAKLLLSIEAEQPFHRNFFLDKSL